MVAILLIDFLVPQADDVVEGWKGYDLCNLCLSCAYEVAFCGEVYYSGRFA